MVLKSVVVMSMVLLYGAVRSPLAQPRNLLGGHVISALVGVTGWTLFFAARCLAQAVAVATAISLMHSSRTLHPPGTTALIAVIGLEEIHAMGYFDVLIPATLGLFVLSGVALIVNTNTSTSGGCMTRPTRMPRSCVRPSPPRSWTTSTPASRSATIDRRGSAPNPHPRTTNAFRPTYYAREEDHHGHDGHPLPGSSFRP
jgi:hypothetical protein